jgi:fumarate hydratase class II
MIYNFLHSARLIGDVCVAFNDKCAVGIEPLHDSIQKHVNNSLMLVTALNPKIGYYNAAAIAQDAHKRGITLKQAALEFDLKGLDFTKMTSDEFDAWVRPENMVGKI